MDVNVIEVTPHAPWVMITFLIGYTAIIIEQIVKLNKAATALLMGIACWTILFFEPAVSLDKHLYFFSFQMLKVSQVLLFLLGALTIVEIIDVHKGFQIIAKRLFIYSKRRMLWTSCLVTFFLSAVLDNLTTTIVMVSLIAKIVENKEERWLLGGGIVIAANAGGAWTPIGDVTTTLLWTSGQVTTLPIMRDLFIPSIIGLVVALLWLNFQLKGEFIFTEPKIDKTEPGATVVLILGLCTLAFVPFFRVITDLPAVMGMMFSLTVMWVITDVMHHKHEERTHLRVVSVLPKVGFPTILFYLGVLLSIDALESAGLLKSMSLWLDSRFPMPMLIPVFIGLVSSVVDNVSVVAAMVGMYDLTKFPVDSTFWQAIAYCAATGGSILIIGSAAGFALMALEKMDFLWYTKRITLPALLAYFVGMGVYLLLSPFTHR